MDLQIDIYQCGSNHVHVVLRGQQAEGAVAFNDMEAFVKFIEACQDFIFKGGRKNTTEIPSVFLDAFREEGR